MQIKTDFFFFYRGQSARGRMDMHPVHSWQVCKLARDKENVGTVSGNVHTAQPNPASRNVPKGNCFKCGQRYTHKMFGVVSLTGRNW